MAKRNEAPLLVLVAMAMVVFLSVQVKSAVGASIPTTYTTKMQEAVRKEVEAFPNSLLPGLIRLLFHDCFVNGCDGSVLLKTSRMSSTDGKTEMTSGFNVGLRGLEVIDNIKKNLGPTYGITCTDAVIYAAREAVYLLSHTKIAYDVAGPGRKDGVISRSEDPGNQLPGTNLDFAGLEKNFQAKGLSAEDVVVLSGAHAVGVANRTNAIGATSPIVDTRLTYKRAILEEMGTKDIVKNNVRDFNNPPPDYEFTMRAKGVLDNTFYNAVSQKMVLFPTDRVLWESAKASVTDYKDHADKWYKLFGNAMARLSMLPAPSGAPWEDRIVCSKTN